MRTYRIELDGTRYHVDATVWPEDRETGAGQEIELHDVATPDGETLTDAAILALGFFRICEAVYEAHDILEAEDAASRAAWCGW